MSLTVEEHFTWGNNACHAITPQWTTRRHIGAYLERAAPILGTDARSQIPRAADLYRAADAAWIRFDELLGQRFVHVHAGKQNVGWADPARRKEAADAVYLALGHEEAAIASLRRALESID